MSFCYTREIFFTPSFEKGGVELFCGTTKSCPLDKKTNNIKLLFILEMSYGEGEGYIKN